MDSGRYRFLTDVQKARASFVSTFLFLGSFLEISPKTLNTSHNYYIRNTPSQGNQSLMFCHFPKAGHVPDKRIGRQNNRC
jgi:hypothetical protein